MGSFSHYELTITYDNQHFATVTFNDDIDRENVHIRAEQIAYGLLNSYGTTSKWCFKLTRAGEPEEWSLQP